MINGQPTGELVVAKNKYVSVSDAAKAAGVDAQGAVIIFGCRVGKNVNLKALNAKDIHTYATDAWTYFNTLGEATTSTQEIDPGTSKGQAAIRKLTKGHKPEDVELPQIGGTRDKVTLSDDPLGEARVPNILNVTVDADQRVRAANTQTQGTQPAKKGR